MKLSRVYVIICIIILPLSGRTQIIKNKNLKKIDSIHLVVHKENLTDTIFTNRNNITSKLDSIHKKLINDSYIYNKLIPEKVVKKNEFIEVYYKICMGKNQKINKLLFLTEKKKFPRNLKKYFEKKYINSPLNTQTLNRLKKDINLNSCSYTTKSITPIIYKGISGLRMNLIKKKNNSVNGVLGLKKDNNNIEIEGMVDLKLKNIFIQNEQINLFWKKNKEEQNFSINALFPYLLGTNIFYNNETYLNNTRNNSFLFYTYNKTGWQFKKNNIGVIYSYNKKIEKINSTENNFIGTSFEHIFKIKIHNNVMFTDKIYTEINYNFSGNNDFNLYNYIQLYLKTAKNQFLKIDSHFQFSKQRSLIIKKDLRNIIFPYNTLINSLHPLQIYLLNTKYMLIKNNFSIYLLSEFSQIGKKKLINNEVQAGFGMDYFTKNQTLTFEIRSSVYKSHGFDFQNITINIKQNIRF